MNPIRDALRTERATLGSWFGIRCPVTAERFGAIGFDWVIIDLQHGAASWDGLIVTMQALQLGGTRSLVRVSGHDPAEVGRALDIGAIGVVVPMVSTPEQARSVADAMRYPPMGTRSFGLLRNALGGAPMSHEPFCIVMIETVEGIANLDAIAATPGVDCVLLGGIDLGISMGLSREQVFAQPPVAEVVAHGDALVAACEKHGKIAGNGVSDAADVAGEVARGMRFITINSAAGMLVSMAKSQLALSRLPTET